MAKQSGELFIAGTVDNLTFYRMEGNYYVRMKSSLTRKRFMKDKAFARSKKSAERFALGNQLASKVYRMVDAERREYTLFCFLKKRAIALLKEGKSVREAKEVLMDYLIGFGMIETKSNKTNCRKDIYTSEIWKYTKEIFCKNQLTGFVWHFPTSRLKLL